MAGSASIMSVMWNGGVDRRVGCEVDTHGSGMSGSGSSGSNAVISMRPRIRAADGGPRGRFAVRAPAVTADPSHSHPWHDS